MCVSRIGAHTVHPIAMKLSQVVGNVLAVVLEIKKIVLAGISSVALHSDLDEILKICAQGCE